MCSMTQIQAQTSSTDGDVIGRSGVQKMLGLTRRSASELLNSGALGGWKTEGGHWRVLRSSVEKYREARRVSPVGGAA
jgi:excisionase family DNA binding protein